MVAASARRSAGASRMTRCGGGRAKDPPASRRASRPAVGEAGRTVLRRPDGHRSLARTLWPGGRGRDRALPDPPGTPQRSANVETTTGYPVHHPCAGPCHCPSRSDEMRERSVTVYSSPR
jgi:hypothetical protein